MLSSAKAASAFSNSSFAKTATLTKTPKTSSPSTILNSTSSSKTRGRNSNSDRMGNGKQLDRGANNLSPSPNRLLPGKRLSQYGQSSAFALFSQSFQLIHN